VAYNPLRQDATTEARRLSDSQGLARCQPCGHTASEPSSRPREGGIRRTRRGKPCFAKARGHCRICRSQFLRTLREVAWAV